MGQSRTGSWLNSLWRTGSNSIRTNRQLRAWLNGMRFFLADPEHLSLLALVDQLSAESSALDHFYRIKGGNDRLATALADTSTNRFN